MKALTIKEPWATLIIEGIKQYEFRSWKTNYRGKILIHAGMNFDNSVKSSFGKKKNEYCYGAIIGEVTIADCILIDDDFDKELRKINPLVYGEKSRVNLYAWKLKDIIKYDKPIKIKGKLGLWNYPVIK